MRHRFGWACAVALLLLAALGLRLWWASGWPHQGRSWDERYSLQNVRSLLVTGSLEPANSFYPSPVYFVPPAIAIRAARPFVTDPATQLFDPSTGGLGPKAYLIGRGIQALYGTAGVLLVYLLGATLFGRSTGLLAATTLAFIPWFVQVSGIFKPDAQVVFFILAVFLIGVRWMRAPTAPNALAVGGVVALATSSKLIAGLAGAAFGVGAIARAREKRHYGQILLAGVGSVVLFLVLNPHLDNALWGLERIQADYARRAAWAGMTRWEIPLRTVRYLLAPTVLGPLFGLLAFIGFGALWVSGLRALRAGSRELAGPRLMLAAFPLLYVAVHTARSAWFRDNNFTHILPSFVLGFAWVVTTLLDRTARRFPIARPIRAAAVVGLGALVVSPGVLFVYRTYTPSTLDAAAHHFGIGGADILHGRIVLLEPVFARGDDYPLGGVAVPLQRRRQLAERGVAMIRIPDVTALPDDRRWLSDAEILRGDVPAGIRPAARRELEVFQPRFRHLRGPTVTVVKHRWRKVAVHGPLASRRLPGGDTEVDLPAVDGAIFRSITMKVNARARLTPDEAPVVKVGGETFPTHRTELRDRSFGIVSERFRSPGPEEPTVRVSGLPTVDGALPEIYMYVWAPPPIPAGFSSWRDWRDEMAKL